MPYAAPHGRLCCPSARPVPHLCPGRALCLAALIVCACLVSAGRARAALITPSISTGVGYDDNVRLKQEARADFFAQVTPGIKMKFGRDSNSLEFTGSITYAQYHRLTEETGIQGGDAGVRYKRRWSPAWYMELATMYSSTVDPVEETTTGGLAQVRDDSTRRDRVTTYVMGEHAWGDMSKATAAYTYTWTDSTDSGQENANYHQVDLTFSHRLNQDYLVQAEAKGTHDDYELTPDVNRGNLTGRLVRMIGPTKQASVGLVYDTAQSLSDDPTITKARDYQTYGGQLGWTHKVSPGFDYSITGGWTMVSGDEKSNAAAGQGYPTLDAKATYRGQSWEIEGHAKASLGEYDFLGDNSGLTVTQSAGGSWNWKFARHWSIKLLGDYIHDDYKQDPALADTTTNQGVVDTVRLGTILSWQFSKHFSLSLDYRYLNRDAEQDDDDRSQNRILLLLTGEWPRQW